MGCRIELIDAAVIVRARGTECITTRELAKEHFRQQAHLAEGEKVNVPKATENWVFYELPYIVKVFNTQLRYSCDLVTPYFFEYYKEHRKPPSIILEVKLCIPTLYTKKRAGLWFGTGDDDDLIHFFSKGNKRASGLGKVRVADNDDIDGVNERGLNLQAANTYRRTQIKQFEPKDVNHPVLRTDEILPEKKDVQSEDAHKHSDEGKETA